MFGLGTGELALIIIAGLVIFGPERLPQVAQEAGRVLRQLRRMADDVRNDITEELGPELADLKLSDFSPRGLVHKHLLDPALDEIDDARRAAREAGHDAPPPAAAAATAPVPVALTKQSPAGDPAAAPMSTPYDADAT